MAEILPEQFRAVPRYAEQVLDGASTEASAVHRLSNDMSMNPVSANDYLNFYLGLHRGLCHQRAVQVSAIEYYMERMEAVPAEKKNNAIKALKAYVDYYKRSNAVKRPKVELVFEYWRDRWRA